MNEEPEWVWMRSDEAGNNIVLRLDQENGYVINVTQGDMEIRDYLLEEIMKSILISVSFLLLFCTVLRHGSYKLCVQYK